MSETANVRKSDDAVTLTVQLYIELHLQLECRELPLIKLRMLESLV